MPNDKDTLEEIKQRALRLVQYGAMSGGTYDSVIAPLLQQIEQQQAEIERWKRDGDRLREELGVTLKRWDESDKNLQQSRERLLEELEILKLNLETQVRHFNDTTEELEKAYEECDAIEAERDDYRKVLEWVRDAGTDYQSINKAGAILSRYPSERGE